ncbi:MAG: hypothetical protein K6F09_05540 [Clostridiales bacterium]|nr:hypothetical protein [Clostridiales bacterium]
MNKTAQRALFHLFNCFAILLIVRIIEEFLLVGILGDTHSIIVCVFGIIFVFAYLRVKLKPIEKIGLIVTRHKITKGFVLAVLINVIPFVLINGFIYFYYKSLGCSVSPAVFFDTAARSRDAAGTSVFLMWLLFALAVAVLHAVFYEISFRGLLIHFGNYGLSYTKTNLLQSGLYTLWFLIPLLKSITSTSKSNFIFLFVFFILYEFITAYKLGLCRFATGALWLPIFDHLAFGYYCDCFRLQVSTAEGTLLNNQLDFRFLPLLIYQVVSFIIVFIYYLNKKSSLGLSTASGVQSSGGKTKSKSKSKK